MTKDDLKRRLHEYRNIKAEIAQIEDLLDEIEEKKKSPKGASLVGAPKGSHSGDPMTGIVSRSIELENTYGALRASLLKEQSWIEARISELDSKERRMMRCYYLDGMTWEQVCVKMEYSWSQIHRLHSAALDSLLARCNNNDDIE